MRFDQLGWHRAPVVKVSQGCVRVFRAGREHLFCRGFDTTSFRSRTIQAPFVSRDSNVLGDRRTLAALGEVAGVNPNSFRPGFPRMERLVSRAPKLRPQQDRQV